MRITYLTAALAAAGLLLTAPTFAQSTSTTNTTTKPAHHATHVAKKQHTDGEDVTGNNNFPSATSGARKQRTDGEDVTGNNNFPAASK